MATNTGSYGDNVSGFGICVYRQLICDISNRYTANVTRSWNGNLALWVIIRNANRSVIRKNRVSNSALLTLIRNTSRSVIRTQTVSNRALLTIISDFSGSMHRNGSGQLPVNNALGTRYSKVYEPLLSGHYISLDTRILRAGIGQPIAGGVSVVLQSEGQLWPRFL